MSLGDFLTDGPAPVSWADDDIALPSAPMAVEGAPMAIGRMSLADAPERRDHGGRREYGALAVDFPTGPPFTAFVGNLPFETDEAKLRELFGEGVEDVRLIRDRDTDRLRGFGYVEFKTLDALKKAVAMDGVDAGGRALRVGVSEARQEDRLAGVSTWRRADAVEPSSAFGPRSSSGYGRAPRELREPREPREPLEPTAAETVSDWRMHKEPPPAAEPRRAPYSSGRFSRTSSGDAPEDTRNWRTEPREPLPPREPREPRETREPRESR
ncbi:Eukaryotic translation initiation factor 4B, partial [Coemansia nantahalensis]